MHVDCERVKRWWVWVKVRAVPAAAVVLGLVIGLFFWLGREEAVGIAIVAALAAVAAAYWAGRAGELVRATARPFLNVAEVRLQVARGGVDPTVCVAVRNTGSLPADQVGVEVFLREYEDMDGMGKPLDEHLVLPGICFPGEAIGPSSHVMSPQQRELIAGKFVVVRVTYQSRASGTAHETVRGFWVSPREEAPGRPLCSPKGLVPEATMDRWT